MRGHAIALLAGMLLANPVSAQTDWPVAVGDRVRVTLASRFATAPIIGTVISVSRDSLVLSEDGDMRPLTAAQVAKVEVGPVFIVPLAILLPFALIKSEAGAGATVLSVLLVSVASVTTFGGRVGSGPQDLWFEAAWPPAVAALDTTAAAPDSTMSAIPVTAHR